VTVFAAMRESAYGTDQRSALPRQPHQVSEGKQTRQRGSWEAAATAACDPTTDLADLNKRIVAADPFVCARAARVLEGSRAASIGSRSTFQARTAGHGRDCLILPNTDATIVLYSRD